MFRASHLSLIALSACLLTGCMFFETRTSKEIRHQPTYKLGYDDGCATATAEGANMRHGDMVRDDSLYDTDKAYHAGWATGHGACRRLAPAGQSEGPLNDVAPGANH